MVFVAILFALSQSGFIAGAAMPGTLHNLLCCDLWPPGTDSRRAQLSLTFIPMFPFSSHFFSLYPFFTHGKWAQIKSLLKCALLNAIPAVITPHYKKCFNALVILVTKLWVVKVLRFRFPCDCVRRATVMRMTLRCPLASREAGQLIG